MFRSRFLILHLLTRNCSKRRRNLSTVYEEIKVNFERVVQPYLERIPSDSLIFLISDRGFIESTDSQGFSEEALQMSSGTTPSSTLHWFINPSHGHRFRALCLFRCGPNRLAIYRWCVALWVCDRTYADCVFCRRATPKQPYTA